MLAHLAAAVVQDRARVVRQVVVEELAERPLADEADAGRILLLRVRQADLVGDAAHLGLVQLADREQRLRQLRLVQAVQEVALVLARVEPLEQLVAARRLVEADARVVAGGDALGARAASRGRGRP